MGYLRRTAPSVAIAVVLLAIYWLTTGTVGSGPYIVAAVVLVWLAVGLVVEIRARGRAPHR